MYDCADTILQVQSTCCVQRPCNRVKQNSNKGGDQLIGQQLNLMLVIFLYKEVLLFSNQKLPCWACEGTKPTSYKNAQHHYQLRCWSTKARVLSVFIKRYLAVMVLLWLKSQLCFSLSQPQSSSTRSKVTHDFMVEQSGHTLNCTRLPIGKWFSIFIATLLAVSRRIPWIMKKGKCCSCHKSRQAWWINSAEWTARKHLLSSGE